MAKRRKRTNKNVPAKGRLCKFADDLWSLAVRDDWANKCARCGKSSVLNVLNAHHLINRWHESVRYSLNNGICLCSYCHVRCPKYSPHLNGPSFRAWLKENYPETSLWVDTITENGTHWCFRGTKNPTYYIHTILRLKEYVDEDEFVRVVGVRFAQWLEDNSE